MVIVHVVNLNSVPRKRSSKLYKLAAVFEIVLLMLFVVAVLIIAGIWDVAAVAAIILSAIL